MRLRSGRRRGEGPIGALTSCWCRLLAAAVLAGCGGAEATPTRLDEGPVELTGLVVGVNSSGESVSSFTLHAGGMKYDIRLASEVDYGFGAAHLREHQESLWPVRCRLESRSGTLYALSVEDA